MRSWLPRAWQRKHNVQTIPYPRAVRAELKQVLRSLSALPALVSIERIQHLKTDLIKASQGKAFLLQAGDCAERFLDANPDRVSAQLNLLQQLSEVLEQRLHKPIITVGRMAGQYAKPRSFISETRGDISLPSYRGDLINGSEFTAEARAADPKRLAMGYYYAQQCLDLIHQRMPSLYTSHEALHLLYEQSLTRQFQGTYYNVSTHFPWVGVRTSEPSSAHIEYLRGLSNPVAVKMGPRTTAEWIKQLARILNPEAEPGKLSFIHRLGAGEIKKLLPPLIAAVQETCIPVVWICDPMHANTARNAEGYKLRSTDIIAEEFQQAIEIHQRCGTHLSGLHLELTSDSVQECVNGQGVAHEESILKKNIPLVDPRLNAAQAMKMLETIDLLS